MIKPNWKKDERAWRSVRGEQEPYSESDWRRDNELHLKDNQDLEERLKAILNVKAEFEATKDKLNVYVTGKRFEVECRGLKYIVKSMNTIFHKAYSIMCLVTENNEEVYKQIDVYQQKIDSLEKQLESAKDELKSFKLKVCEMINKKVNINEDFNEG